MRATYLLNNINPEPWTPGQIGVRNHKRFMYKDAKLTAFQKAVASQLKQDYPEITKLEGDFTLHMWFWRSTEGGGQPADRTNLQKATEDALQGVLFKNDRCSISGYSEIVEQGPDVEPCIIIEVMPLARIKPPVAVIPVPATVNEKSDPEERERREGYDPEQDF